MIPWVGVGCCMSAAALYLLGRKSGRDADVLKSATRVGQLKDLAAILDTDCKALPLVKISGRVGSDAPINCEPSALRGVIVEEREELHFLKQDDAGSFERNISLKFLKNTEVPWYLDDETGRVYVEKAHGATGLVLTVASDVFEDSKLSLDPRNPKYLQGPQILGVRRIIEVLPIGTSLTVVGEAVKDDTGRVRVQRPHKGPFYVSQKDTDQLISDLGEWAWWYNFASLGFTAVGACLLAKHAAQYFLERRHWWELHKRWYKFASLGFTAIGAYLLANHAAQYFLERRRRKELHKS
ncbi:E3 ubiquitin-protein ligase SP1-like isoform X2 [Typha angustifolia]|uniref:E3 ubiquitin-protein ligase SP1-like isoform X2 n=1 Tax=Typha angustifolia TaxID=59011 RepID=UPI003C2FE7E1